MPEKKSSLVALCQQFLALATVAALAAPATGVVSLDIVAPAPGEGGTEPTRTPVALVASESVEPEVTEVPVDGVEQAGLQALTPRPAARQNAAAELAALSAPAEVDGFATVGVTWSPEERLAEDDVEVSVRTLDQGRWGPWHGLEYHDDHGPDPDSPEAQGVRPGTDPIVVGDVDEVQVKLTTADGEAPADTELALVDPKATPDPTLAEPAIDTADLATGGTASLAAATAGSTDSSGARASDAATAPASTEEAAEAPDAGLQPVATVTPRPQIFSRAQWGADESLRDKSSLRYNEIHAGFVHHTVNANGYTRDQVPSLLRGIYAYHTKSRGWSDIGYNFIVDRFGRIWEGRYGGVDRPVVGAHTLGYNEYSFAMSALGNFDTASAPAVMLDAYGRLFAWKLSLHGVSASSTKQWVGSRYFAAINGHRDAGQTACPGRYLYGRLGTIRTLASGYQAPFTGRARSTSVAGSAWPDIVVRDRVTKKAYVVRTGGQTNLTRRRRAAIGWGAMDLVAASRDLTGDGIPDVLARDRNTKRTGLYPGTSTGALGVKRLDTARFADVDQMVGSLDLTGDGHNDVVARNASTKALFVHPGNGAGRFYQRVRLSASWEYGLTAAVGDFNGDGRNDLAARNPDGLFLVPGTRGGGLAAPVRLPGRWGSFAIISGAGDLTNDGRPDLVVKTRKTKLTYLVPGNGRGGVLPRLGPFPQFADMNYLASPGNLRGNSANDLVARDSSGRLFVYANNGFRNIEAVTDSGTYLYGVNAVLNVGDWNGDGNGDLVTRTGTGKMLLRPGDGRGGFGAAVLLATGWEKIGLLAAVGDMTGDGRPDLMGQPAGGAMRIYPGNGAAGFLPSYSAHAPISANRHTGPGRWNRDGSPDTLTRRGDGSLYLYSGNGPGGLTGATRVGSGASQYDWLESPGDLTGDGRPDIVGRDGQTGVLWLLPGTRSGIGAPRVIAEGFGRYDRSS